MKTIPTFLLWAGLASGVMARPADVPTDPPEQPDAAAAEAVDSAGAGSATASETAAAAGTGTNQPPAQAEVAGTNTFQAPLAGTNSADGLRLNFRNAPLEMVLNYLSDAAGFVIVLETEVKGKVDVWSNQPVTKDEAVTLLNAVLNRNGYSAIRNDRTLTIVSRDEAKKRDIPVRTGNKPEEIPKNEEMVTQIIAVRYANAVQMVKDLQPLLPTYANLTANESGNALVLTDVQSDIRRMVEIVRALDTSISGIATIRVYPLRYADAKELANEIKELFPATSTGTGAAGGRGGNNPIAQMMAGRFGGGPGGGGFGGAGAAAAAGTGASEARQAASRVTAVADERTNSLVVSAPEEVMGTIEQLVKEIDTNAENITELRVFRLKHSDPQEIVDVLLELFPDDTRTDNNRSSVQVGRGGPGGFGGAGGFFGRGGGQNTQAASSTRARQKGRVLAVAELRTSSVVVSAASDLMPQISEMIQQLDNDPAKKQKVFVYSLENADASQVQQVLSDMFERNSTTRNSRSSTTQNNALTTRSQQNQGTTSGSRSSSSSFGGSSGMGGSRGTGGPGF